MNIIRSIYTYKCPKCRRGDLFVKPFNPLNPLNMPYQCEVCGQKTMPSPGFYYGSMFISYIITGFPYLGLMFSLIYFFSFSVYQAFGVLILFAALTYFKAARISRSIWIHTMVSYDKEKYGKQ